MTRLARSRPGTFRARGPRGDARSSRRSALAWGQGRPPGRALPVLVPFALLACLLTAPRPAASQPRGQAQADSSRVTQIMQTLSPSYSTGYQVARQRTIWSQDFNFGTGFGFMNFNNKTSFSIRHDSDRNEETRDGSNSTDLRWYFIPGLPITSSMKLGRLSITRPESQTETNNSGLNLSARYQKNLLGIDHVLDGGVGYNRRTDLNVIADGRSRTQDAGVNGSMNWKGSWSPSDPLTLNAHYQESRTQKRLQLESTDGSVDKRPSSSRSRTTGADLGYEPVSWLSATVSANDVTKRDEFFRAQEEALEKQVSGSTNLSGQFSMKRPGKALLELGPLQVSEMSADLSYNAHDLTFQVRPDVASSGNTASWKGRTKGSMLGTSIEGSLANENSRLEPATSDTTVTYTHTFEGKLSRSLSSKISVRFDWLVRSTQVFFETFDPKDRLDRDELKTKFQPALTYTPNKRWSVTASYIRTGSRQIQLNPARASQTRDDVDYSVDMAIRCQVSTRTSFTQNYSIKARYTTLDFNPSGNQLIATQRIITSVRSQITPRVKLSMDHRFTLQDSGPFSFGPGGERLFGRSVRKYTQEMKPHVEYQITPWGSIYVNSTFRRIDNDNELSRSRATARTLELEEGFKVTREVGAGVDLQATGSFNRSNVRDSYWNITSKLSKDF